LPEGRPSGALRLGRVNARWSMRLAFYVGAFTT
jgi:hypothetical protein